MRPLASIAPHRLAPGLAEVPPELDDIQFCAWVATAEPGDCLHYHTGFLALDALIWPGSAAEPHVWTLRDLADAAMRAAEDDLVHLVQARLGPDRFAYLAIARKKPAAITAASLSARLLEAA